MRRSWRLLLTTVALGAPGMAARPALAQAPPAIGNPAYLPAGGSGFLPYTPGPGGGLGVMPPSAPLPARMSARPTTLGGGMSAGVTAGPRTLLPGYRGSLGLTASRGLGGGAMRRSTSGMTGRAMPRRPPVGSYPFRQPAPLTPLAPAGPNMSM